MFCFVFSTFALLFLTILYTQYIQSGQQPTTHTLVIVKLGLMQWSSRRRRSNGRICIPSHTYNHSTYSPCHRRSSRNGGESKVSAIVGRNWGSAIQHWAMTVHIEGETISIAYCARVGRVKDSPGAGFAPSRPAVRICGKRCEREDYLGD